MKILTTLICLIGLTFFTIAQNKNGLLYEAVPKNDKSFDELISIWIPTISKNGIAVEYIKGETLEGDGTLWGDFLGGIEFKENGVLIVRQKAGMCGSGPISIGSFGGSWEYLSDSTLRINYPYNDLGERTVKVWQILELNSNRLKIKVINNWTETSLKHRLY